VTGFGAPLTAIDRSALAPTVVVMDAMLLARFGSAVVAPTVAVLPTIPAWAGAVTAIVIGAAAPSARLAIVQVTTWPAFEQAQPVPLALTNTTVGSSESVMVIVLAVLGPPFVTSTV
jgi:hypothetical protein